VSNRKFGGFLLGVLFAVAALIGGFDFYTAKTVKADTGDTFATFFGSAASTGTVISAGTSSQRIILKDLVLTSTTSVTLVVQEHPASGPNITIAQVGLIANTPYRLDATYWNTSPSGYVTGAGSSIVVVAENLAASTASLSARYSLN